MLTSQEIMQSQLQGKELLQVEKQVKYRGTLRESGSSGYFSKSQESLIERTWKC